MTIISKLPLSGPLALNSAKVQGEDQKDKKKVFTFDQHPKPLFSAKIQVKVKTKKTKKNVFTSNLS